MQKLAQRELLMASGLVNQARYEGYFEITTEVSEAGWADLSRLQILAARTSSTDGWRSFDLLPQTTIESVRIHNTRELIRGQGEVISAPAGVFSPFRQYGAIQLGKWWLEGGNTITVRLRSHAAEANPSDAYGFAYSMAFPFQPDNAREYREPHLAEDATRSYVASPWSCHRDPHATNVGSTPPIILELRFDQDGVADLNTLQIATSTQPTDDFNRRILASAAIRSILLPTRQELILGGTDANSDYSRAAPAGIFASLGRRFEWVKFGLLEVSTNNALVVEIDDLTPGNLVSAEAPKTESGDGENPRGTHSPKDSHAPQDSAPRAYAPRYSMGLQFYPNERPRK